MICFIIQWFECNTTFRSCGILNILSHSRPEGRVTSTPQIYELYKPKAIYTEGAYELKNHLKHQTFVIVKPILAAELLRQRYNEVHTK